MATVNSTTTALYLNFSTNISMTVNATRIAGTTSVTISGSVSVSQPGSYNLDPIQAWLTDDNTGTQLGPDIMPKAANVASGTANFSYTFDVQSYNAGSRNISAHFFCVDASYGQADLTATVSYGSAYTAPTTPTISAVVDSPTQITVTYGTTSFGNPSTGTIYLYGGTSAAPTTQIDSKTTTGNNTYVYSGLTPNTTYYFRSRASNGQLNSNYSTEINVTTSAQAYKLYGPVSGQTKKINKLYGSVNGQTKEVVKLYGSVNGQTKRIF